MQVPHLVGLAGGPPDEAEFDCKYSSLSGKLLATANELANRQKLNEMGHFRAVHALAGVRLRHYSIPKSNTCGVS
jgi:hypothetical protein